MESISGFVHEFLAFLKNPGPVITQIGYPGLMAIIFLETGALIALLPGDSLLVVAGLYAAQADMARAGASAVGEGAAAGLNIWLLNLLLIPCAILGDATSYSLGKRVGPKLFSRPKSLLFNPDHARAAQAFYDKHGGKAIIIARFMPIVRTFVPVIAGIGNMPYSRFFRFNVVGGATWISSMTLLGYFAGQKFPWVAQNIEKVIVAVVVLSVLPGILAWLKSRFQSGSSAKSSV